MSKLYSDPQRVLDHFAKGEFVIVNCEDKEKEGDFFILAEAITPEKVNFLLTKAKGMICVALDASKAQQLDLWPMVENPADKFGTNFLVSVDAAKDLDTGVSAKDRAQTIKVLADPKSTASDLVRPGHSHPLLARDASVRWGHTECSVYLAKAAQKQPTVVICEILNHNGAKANFAELMALAKDCDCPITSLSQLKSFLIPS